jgi:hypothetical protein
MAPEEDDLDGQFMGMAADAVALFNLFKALVGAGFTEDQALRFIVYSTVESQRGIASEDQSEDQQDPS